MKTALFPGSFDPFTVGHQALVSEGLRFFDKIVVAVGENPDKRGLLTTANRKRLIEDLYKDEPRVEVVSYSGLTGNYCRENELKFILRGMRNTVDFDFERNMMQINQRLYPEITTVLLFTPSEYVAVSSSVIREILSFGGDVAQFMPQGVDIKDYL
ncbi:MAG: pantetheine-phosphate adenylyltransferase [Tidjanibacter sp.]|nr:pantetheine-phosphate adenylyltransferase [Tidjanibacter sp.]MBR3682701.1 pantetheine-phosphate adenylyltransferase [Tidjanibacter sp.]MBR7129484.1 pantetheine-phosphate adenylyltransferase [Tidjanibacter sp.]